MADGDAGVLPRFLDSVAKLRHRLNSAATDVGQRQRINWVDTATVTWTVTESSVNEEVLISATGATQTTLIPGYYGDISDGTATMDGSTTVAGIAPSSNIYTATRDLFFDSLTINNGQIFKPSGFRVFVQGTLTNNGTISWNGNVGGNGSGSTGGAAGISLTPGSVGGSPVPGGGGNASNTGTIGGIANPGYGGNGGAGGSDGATHAGGGTGTATAPLAIYGGVPRSVPLAVLLQFTDNSSIWNQPYGGGGGAGGGAGAASSGGGGGSGAGVIFIAARLFAGTGLITATGGAGGNAAGTNAGGGGGGGGGAIFIVSSSVSAGAIAGQTITAAGGALGTKLGTGVNGTAGSAGRVIYIQG